MKRQVLFVFGTQACVPCDPLLAAEKLGCRSAILGPRIPCGMPHELAENFVHVNLSAPDEVVATAQALHRQHPVHAVLGYDDQAVPLVARIAAALGLPGHPVEAADAARDKILMKSCFEAAGIPIAPFKLATDEDDAVQWARETGYPVVVKPVRGSASQGVIRADSEAELRQAYRRVRRIVREFGLETGERSDAEQIVEKYIHGSEFSAELLIQNGTPNVLCVFEKPQPLHGPFFEETIYATPARLPRELNHEIQQLAARAVKALGLRHGAAHCEIRLSSGTPVVLEIGARVIGGACSRVFRHILDEEIHSCLIRLALGDSFSLPSVRPGAAGAMMLPIPKEGRLRDVEGIEDARGVAGIQDVIITANPGDVIIPFPEQGCYIGFLTSAAGTTEAAVQALVRSAELIQLHLTPLTYEHWTVMLDRDQTFQPHTEHRITCLEDCNLDKARTILLPIVAAAEFGEEPAPLATAKAREYLSRMWEDRCDDMQTIVCVIGGEHGVALGSAKGSACYLNYLGLLDNCPESGLGEALVRTMMDVFARRGCAKMDVLLDPRRQEKASLYRKLGFAPQRTNADACCA